MAIGLRIQCSTNWAKSGWIFINAEAKEGAVKIKAVAAYLFRRGADHKYRCHKCTVQHDTLKGSFLNPWNKLWSKRGAINIKQLRNISSLTYRFDRCQGNNHRISVLGADRRDHTCTCRPHIHTSLHNHMNIADTAYNPQSLENVMSPFKIWIIQGNKNQSQCYGF